MLTGTGATSALPRTSQAPPRRRLEPIDEPPTAAPRPRRAPAPPPAQRKERGGGLRLFVALLVVLALVVAGYAGYQALDSAGGQSVQLREDVGGSVEDAIGELRGLIEDNTPCQVAGSATAAGRAARCILSTFPAIRRDAPGETHRGGAFLPISRGDRPSSGAVAVARAQRLGESLELGARPLGRRRQPRADPDGAAEHARPQLLEAGHVQAEPDLAQRDGVRARRRTGGRSARRRR